MVSTRNPMPAPTSPHPGLRSAATCAPAVRAASRPRRSARVAALVLLCGALLGGTLTGVGGGATPADAAVTWQTDMLNQVNAARAGQGQAPLRLCANLARAAQAHAADMAARGYFNHVTPEGTSFVDRAPQHGYAGFSTLGENIAMGYPDVASVMAGWLASAGHRENILAGKYAHVGFGLAYGAGGTPYWVQDFGAGGQCGASAIGTVDSLTSGWPQTATVTGWTFDAQSPTAALSVDVYVDGGRIGRYAANVARPDLTGPAFAEAGTNHGYQVTFNASPGLHQVCVWAIGVDFNPQLGCRSIALASADPVGSFDGASAPVTGGLVRVWGWAFDPETAAPIAMHIYIDGVATVVTAAAPRADIGAAFPGYGPNHGLDATLPAAAGTHQVCVWAINAFLGVNRLFGCRSVTVRGVDPIGRLDRVTPSAPRTVTVGGWALDPEASDSIEVDLYVDGVKAGRFLASQRRDDIGAAFGRGPDHGFAVPLSVAPGAHTVCAYGINLGAGGNATLGCAPVTVPGDPVGSLDSAAGAAGQLTATGWALDPDTAAAITVHVYVDGTFRTSTNANGLRADLAAAFPFFGAGHGYTVAVPATAGSHTVCTYALNTGIGGNRLLGCRTAVA